MIDYTFSITSGAGGFAISPQLTVIRMGHVYHSQAIFVIAELLSSMSFEEEGVCDLIEDAIEKLRGLFCAGDASPFDVDQDGRTLLHVSYI